jgi:predicted site-specific integrase-resolvase
MPVTINGRSYYRSVEVYQTVGISRTTLFRWVKQGICGETELRDRRGWRLFTQDEVDRLKAEVNRITKTERSRLRTEKLR